MRFRIILLLLMASMAQATSAEDRTYISGEWRYATGWTTGYGGGGGSDFHGSEKSAVTYALAAINNDSATCTPGVLGSATPWGGVMVASGIEHYGSRSYPVTIGRKFVDFNNNVICTPGINVQITISHTRDVICPAGYASLLDGSGICRTFAPPPDKNDCAKDCPKNGTNPINSATGHKIQTEPDFQSSASLLAFNRYYTSGTHRAASSLGTHWRHSFDRSLLFVQNTVAPMSMVKLDRPDGGAQYFTRVDGVWQADTGFFEQLEHHAGGWTYTDSDANKEHYSEAGLLLSIENSDGRVLTMQYELDQLIAVVDDQERTLTFAYEYLEGLSNNIKTRLVAIGLPDNQIVKFQYDANGLLERVIYPDATPADTADNPFRRYQYGDGVSATNYQLTGLFDERGIQLSNWEYDSNGNAISSEHGAPGSGIDNVSLTYQADGSTTFNSALNESRNYTYVVVNGVRKIASMSAPCPSCGTNFASRTYDAKGKPDITTDFAGTETDTNYNAYGVLTQKIESANKPLTRRTTQIDYHPTILSMPVEVRVYNASNVLELRSTYVYNSSAQVTAACQIDPNNVSAMAYVCGSATNAPTGVRQNTTTYCEGAAYIAGNCHRISAVLQTNGARTDVNDVVTYTYRSNFHPSCLQAGTFYCPYFKGDLWKVTNSLGQVMEYTLNSAGGRPLQIKDANNVITDMEYDPRGRLTARKVRGSDDNSEADDAITRLEYDRSGQVTKVIQPDSDFVEFTYDDAHRLTGIKDALGNSITYTLDHAGNRTAETTKDPSNTVKRSLSRVYDTLGRLQASKNAANTTLATLAYDASDNLDIVTDGLNRVTDQDVDPLNRLIKTIQDKGVGKINATTQFEYDARDNLVKVIDPKNLNTVYSYNGLNDLTQLSSPDTGNTVYTYDAAGNRKTQTDARNKISTYDYDAANRLTSVSVPTAAQNVYFDYDATQTDCQMGETFTTGRLARIRDESGSTRYCYNRLGQPVRKVQSITSGPNLTLGSTYNAANRMVAMTYPSGAIVTYLRNAKGQITGVSAKPTATGAQVSMVSNATYLPFGPLNTLTFANGRVLTKAYDQNYNIDKVSDNSTTGLSEDSTVNVMGNITAITERTNATANATRQFGYDNLDRLLSLKNGSTNVQSFTYDATGNRLNKTLGTTVTTNTIAPTSHRLTQDGSTARTYDANGNTATIGVKGYVYDDRNRLRDYKNTGGTVTRTYRYNGKGERVSKVQSAGHANNRYYFYDEAGHLLGEYLANGTRVQEYVWLDDQLVAVLSDHDASTYQFVETDHLGTPRAVVHPTENNIVWRWNITNTAFGEHAATNNPDADAVTYTFNLRYPGQYYDAESTLHYNYFRDYEPGTGRYVQSDPIGQAGGLSTFEYVLGNPLQLVDPAGQEGVGYWTFAPGTRERAYYELRPAPTQKEICQKLASVESLLNITPFVGTGKALIDTFVGDSNVMQFASSSGSTAGAVIEYGANREDSALTRRQEVLTRRGGNNKEQKKIAAGLERSAGTKSLVKIFGRATFFIGFGFEIYNINENLEKCECIKN